jgi:glycerophosphoryl diester phosphodiesterase
MDETLFSWPTLDGQPPIIIAHRGASGERPEHTLAAYQLAVEQGADFIEPDLVLTKDGVLIARHENEIGSTTDVASRPEFADRHATKIIDGESITGWFSEDFTWTEIQSLRARERLPELRGTSRDGQYSIPSFAEILDWLAEVNKDREKPIGIYPETKHPSYFASIGLPHEVPLLAALDDYRRRIPEASIFVQSFEVDNLKAIRVKSDLPLIQLITADGAPADHPNLSYAQMLTPKGLADVALYATGIGPEKKLVLPIAPDGSIAAPTSLVRDAHEAGLKVHPWTIRRENAFLPPALRNGQQADAHGDVHQELLRFFAAGVDGIFSDNVAEASTARTKHLETQGIMSIFPDPR